MQKVKITAFLLAVLFLCACSKTAVTPVVRGVTFNAHIIYFNKEYLVLTDIDKNGNTVISVVEPQVISGAKFVVTGEGAYTEYKDIKYPVNIENAEGAPYFLFGCLTDAMDKKGQQVGENFIISGKWQDREYEMYLSGSGIPLKITAKDIEIEILDAKIKTEQ